METIILELNNKLNVENEKLTSILQRRSEIDSEINIILQPKADSRNNKPLLTAKAEAYLKGEEFSPEPDRKDDNYDTLIQEKRLLAEAERLQRIVIKNLISDISNEARNSLYPEYIEIVKDMASHAIALSKAMTRERLFREVNFRDKGLNCSYNACFRQVGELKDTNSRLNMWLNEIVKYGYVTKDEITELVNT